MSVAIDETREHLEAFAFALEAKHGDSDLTVNYLLQAIDALDLLEESLAEATRLADEHHEYEGTIRTLEAHAARVTDVESAWNKAAYRINNILHEAACLKQEV